MVKLRLYLFDIPDASALASRVCCVVVVAWSRVLRCAAPHKHPANEQQMAFGIIAISGK